jgi:hypothetical protein
MKTWKILIFAMLMLVLAFAWTLGCGGGSDDDDDSGDDDDAVDDDDSADDDDDDDVADDDDDAVDDDDDNDDDDTASEPTWSNFVEDWVFQYCADACHSDPPKNDAPYPLVTWNEVASKAFTIIASIDGINKDMPPLGEPQPTQDDVDRFIEWANNGGPL